MNEISPEKLQSNTFYMRSLAFYAIDGLIKEFQKDFFKTTCARE
jgi:hypothetical protein